MTENTPLCLAAWNLLTQVYDPEYGIPITDMGLIRSLREGDGKLLVEMTLTTPTCPAGDVIQDGVASALSLLDGAPPVEVRLVWQPPWSPENLNQAARDALGWTQAP